MARLFNHFGYTVVVIVLVGVGGFFLGGLAVYSVYMEREAGEGVSLAPLAVTVEIPDKKVYASSRGKRYYPWWCEAGKSMAEKNIVWYDTAAAAERAGYTLAKACEQ